MSDIDMTREELDLLRSYVSGPRIWDAASVFPTVLRLEQLGLIAPVSDGGAYSLTLVGCEICERTA